MTERTKFKKYHVSIGEIFSYVNYVPVVRADVSFVRIIASSKNASNALEIIASIWNKSENANERVTTYYDKTSGYFAVRIPSWHKHYTAAIKHAGNKQPSGNFRNFQKE